MGKKKVKRVWVRSSNKGPGEEMRTVKDHIRKKVMPVTPLLVAMCIILSPGI